jgi:hypothetical protein
VFAWLLFSSLLADSAQTHAPPASRWLLGGANWPLSVVDERGLHSTDERACDWARVGSRWLTFDEDGREVGEVRVVRRAKDKSRLPPPCPCPMDIKAELLRGALGKLWLSADSRMRPSPTREWKPTSTEYAALDTLPVRGGRKPFSWFFEFNGRRFAASAGRPLVVAERVGERWQIVPLDGGHEMLTDTVIDLDADGVPEIVCDDMQTDFAQQAVFRFDGSRWRIAARSFR